MSGQRTDAHETEGVAMRAAQVPPRRLRRRRRRDDDRLLQQALDPQAPRLGRGMHPAEVAHAMLAGRRHVLQVTAQELRRLQRAPPSLLRGTVGVAEGHAGVVSVKRTGDSQSGAGLVPAPRRVEPKGADPTLVPDLVVVLGRTSLKKSPLHSPPSTIRSPTSTRNPFPTVSLGGRSSCVRSLFLL